MCIYTYIDIELVCDERPSLHKFERPSYCPKLLVGSASLFAQVRASLVYQLPLHVRIAKTRNDQWSPVPRNDFRRLKSTVA